MCKRANPIRVSQGEKITLALTFVLLLIGLALNIFEGIITIGTVINGVCPVTACTSEVIFYRWLDDKYYSANGTLSASFIIPIGWNVTCLDNLACSYSTVDPQGTFGAYIDRLYKDRLENVCINGACLSQTTFSYKLFYVITTIDVCLVLFIIYLIIKILLRPPKKSFYTLYKSIGESGDNILAEGGT